MFGQILVAVVAVAVTVIAPVGGGTVWAAMANAAIGSAVSQGVGVATGIQEKFSFKGVALSALSAGVMKGVVGNWSPFGSGAAAGSAADIANAAARGLAGSAITQGIGVATGLQSKFDFAGVAAAGIGAGAGAGLGYALGAQPLAQNGSLRNLGANMAVGAARLIANAATRSAISGNSFGDNIRNALPDTIGQIVGDAIGGGIARSGKAATASEAEGKVQTTGAAVENAIVMGTFDADGFNNALIHGSLQGFAGATFGQPDLVPITGAAADRIFARAAQSLIGSDGRSLADIDWSTTMAAVSDTIGANGSYKGGGTAVAGASFLEHARAMLGVSAVELADFAGALGRDSLFKGITDPARILEIGEGYGRQVAADGLGLRIGGRDPAGLRIAESVLRTYAADPTYGPGFAAAADQVAKASAALNREANAVDADVGFFVKTGFTTANGAAAAIDLGYEFSKGDVSIGDIARDGGVALAGVLLTRGKMPVPAAKGASFSSFSALKRHLGSPGAGNQWHHVVEQSKISDFGAEAIHAVDNVVAVPADIHKRISGFYSSKQPFTQGKTVRQWLSGKSFEDQYQFGLEQIRRLSK